MDHNPIVVDVKQVNNEQVAYRIVCCGAACGDACTPSNHVCEDSWHTMHVAEPDHDAKIKFLMKEIASRHEQITKWRKEHGL
jgi:hypothetical protein